MTSVAHERAAEPAAAPTVALSLLDAFELRCEDRVVELPLSAQRLLAFVALHERPLLRVYVAGTLWLEANDARASASLRSSLWRLNRPGHRLVEATPTHLRLDPAVGVDLRQALALARRVIAGSADGDEVDAAQAALGGELLPDWYDDWLLFERERFRQVSLHALEALADEHMRAGRATRALEAALSAVEAEPLRESAHRALIRVHLAEGNRGEALRQYGVCRRLLLERLGVEPSPQLHELLQM